MIPKTLKQYIEQCQFNYVDYDITDKNFPDFENMPNEKTELVYFKKSKTIDKVMKRLAEKNMRPANIKELLVFALQNKEDSKEDSKDYYIALGSSCFTSGGRYFPQLWSSGSRRELLLDWAGRDWDSSCRFLAVKLDKNTKTTILTNSLLESRISALEKNMEKIKKFLIS